MACASEPVAAGHVVLADGYSVPLPALRLLWDLEARGFLISLDESGGLWVRPRADLTLIDQDAIRRHRDVLAALVARCEAIQ